MEPPNSGVQAARANPSAAAVSWPADSFTVEAAMHLAWFAPPIAAVPVLLYLRACVLSRGTRQIRKAGDCLREDQRLAHERARLATVQPDIVRPARAGGAVVRSASVSGRRPGAGGQFALACLPFGFCLGAGGVYSGFAGS